MITLTIIVLGVVGVPVTIMAELGQVNRRNVVGICAICWSLTIILTGVAHNLWEIYLWRFLLGFFEAPFNPFSLSILASFFGPSRRGLALGVAASGGYFGFGMSFAFISVVDLIGWRWTYISTGIGGAVLGALALVTVSNPYTPKPSEVGSQKPLNLKEIWGAVKVEPWSVLFPIFLGFACKMGYQYTLSYNLNNYFVEYFPEFETDLFLSWTLAIAGVLAFCLGGALSDVSGKKYGAMGRLWVIVIVEIIQIPLYVCFILLDLPENLILGILSSIIGDGWTGIGMSAMADIVSTSIRTVIYALFFCVMDVVGGCIMVAVSPITELVGFRYALLWLGTSMLIGGTLFILVSILALHIWKRKPRIAYSMHVDDLQNGQASASKDDEKTPLLKEDTTAA